MTAAKRLTTGNWLTITGIMIALLSGPVAYLFSTASRVNTIEQHDEYQDERLADLENAQARLPELISELKIAIARLESKAPGPPASPTVPGVHPRPAPEPEPECDKKDTDCQIQRMIEKLKDQRERDDKKRQNQPQDDGGDQV
jgi:hypothetical protein